ncbi:hypothetical protein A3A60_00515 [Candidatus Curtissbacteria bacterium RIFCSPLOWO2_01_FULL_42_26]|uniref:LytR/CpsA/Psr regulator C-terminal domain-containing protein n=1 Tax=Candidatus Curtissbacteria bacterium RIFCSPLOWO2_01_FULL_42_26 TaxID=1797729 RepID=A0A1F5I169_9BACT|nr:MAG: hypothetical protein A3A60_00515 [Candidatus Curtissbacteria bacterium RIFCSPLOWO2_01_FULL_42_26]
MDEQTATTNPTTGPAPIYQQSQEKNAKWLWLLIILIILGAVALAFFKGVGPFGKISPFVKKEVASPTPASVSSTDFSASPSPSETEVDRAKPAVRVLNGSGVAGLAASVKDMLENLGWRVASIGNADSSDYAQTEIRLKDDFASYQEALIKDLSDKYSVKISSETLDSTDSADIEIIVGSK